MGGLDVFFYWSVFCRRLPYVILIATLISTAGIAVALVLPVKYRATASILVEAPQIPEQLARPTVSGNGVEQMELIEQRIMTSDSLVALAEQLHVYENKRDLSNVDVAEDMRSRISFEQLTLDSSKQTSFATAFLISFDARSPELAAAVTNEIVRRILHEHVRSRTDRASDTLLFFASDVQKSSADLGVIEDELAKFKSENKDSLPDSLQFRRAEQIRLQGRLMDLEREEAALRDRRGNLAQFLNRTDGTAATAIATPEDEMLVGLRRTLIEQQQIYADDSPTIGLIRSQIKKMEAQRNANYSETAGSVARGKAPTELSIQMAEIDGRLSFINQERTTVTKTLAGLNRSILETPAVEVKLNALQRNYQNAQAQYNSVLAKWVEASTGEQMELRAKGVRFSVIETATPPEKPLASKRLAIAGVSVFGGWLAGLGFILLLELLNKSIRTPAELAVAIQIEPIAVIPYIRTRAEVVNGRALTLAALVVVAFAVPASLFAIHYYHVPVGTLIGKLASSINLYN